MNDIDRPEKFDPGAEPDKSPPQPEGLPDNVIGAIQITFLTDGNTNIGFNAVKVPQMWAASKLLDTIATRMWNEQRDMMVAVERQQQMEVQAAMQAIRQPTDFMAKGGRRRS